MAGEFDPGYITSLHLSKLNLTEVPEKISQCQILLELDLSQNNLDNAEFIRHLKRLKHLDLSKNSLQSLPEIFGSSLILEILLLGENCIDDVPEWMETMPRLRKLDLSDNPVENLLSKPKISWPELRECFLSNVSLSKIPDVLFSCKNLRILDLSNKDAKTRKFGRKENILWNLPQGLPRNLTILRLDSVNLNLLPADICNLKHLEELSASKNALTTLPSTFGGLENLRFCDLSNNQIVFLPETLASVQKLQYLDLYGNVIDGLDVDFENFSALEMLDLWQNYVDPSTICNYDKLCSNLRREESKKLRLSSVLTIPEDETYYSDHCDDECLSENDEPDVPVSELKRCEPHNLGEEERWDEENETVFVWKAEDEDDAAPTRYSALNLVNDEHYFLPAAFHPEVFAADNSQSNAKVNICSGQFDDADE